jgi:regulator of protease activity HflC (stomatin/prohibitin superfamily)
MNLQETLALIEALKLSGVTKFKSGEHEIELTGLAQVKSFNKQEPLTPEAAQVTAEKTAQATEQLKNLINTINLSPEELANKMFPDGAL